MKIHELSSPHFDERSGPIRAIILHATATKNLEETFSYLIASQAPHRVSAHYVIDRGGKIFCLVAPQKRAWHAGKSFWPGLGENLNDCSIGIEFQCPVLKNGQLGGFTKKQIQRGLQLVRQLVCDFQIEPKYVLGHSDVAPERKIDPGVRFPWEEFVAAGVAVHSRRR